MSASPEPTGASTCLLKFRCTQDVVRRQRPPDPLQLELTDRLDPHGVLDRHQHSRTDEHLTRLACQKATPAGGHRRREPSRDVRSWISVETLPHAAE
jgi:hypothetical protein